MEGPLVDKFGIKIIELPASKVYLFKEQGFELREGLTPVNMSQ